MLHKILTVHPADDAVVALTDLQAGEVLELNGESYELKEDVPQKHKFAGKDFNTGDVITMYGVPVGKANEPIAKGALLTIENIKHYANEFSLDEQNTAWAKPDISRFEGRTFQGYHRENGSVGTANVWLVIPLVFCENRNIKAIKDALNSELGYDIATSSKMDVKKLIGLYQNGASSDAILTEDITITAEETRKNRLFPNVDGIKYLTHESGCGGSRHDARTLCALLAGYITHSNVAGATVLSLGCQNAEDKILEEEIEKRDPNFNKPLYLLEQQKSKSEKDFVSEAVKKTFIGLTEANKIERKPAPLSKLSLGLECGGSDGFSGISANPAVGYASDLLATLGGSVVLSEFPELCGVENELAARCETKDLAKRFFDLMQAYNAIATAAGSGFDANPSPGNIKDGLITDAIKSAGAAKKGGTSPVVDVLDYTEPITKPGLSLLCTPGNDVESTTGLAGSGTNMIVFTTGLGTPTGNPVAPVLKIASNTKLANKMSDIIDINTGTIITGEDTIQTKGEEILEHIISVASGEKLAKAQQLGQDDFIPWKRDISL